MEEEEDELWSPMLTEKVGEGEEGEEEWEEEEQEDVRWPMLR